MIDYFVINIYFSIGFLLFLIILDRILTKRNYVLKLKLQGGNKDSLFELNPRLQGSIKEGKLFIKSDVIKFLLLIGVIWLVFLISTDKEYFLRRLILGALYTLFLLINLGHIQNTRIFNYYLKNGKKYNKLQKEIDTPDEYFYDLAIISTYKFIILFAALCFFKPSAFLFGCLLGTFFHMQIFKRYRKLYFKIKSKNL